MRLDLNLLSEEQALECCSHMLGVPAENRVVIAFSEEEKKTTSGIFIPGQVKDGVPKKGVIVKMGSFDEANTWCENTLAVGQVVTYGMYAGKEFTPIFKESWEIPAKTSFTILSANEILFVEPNIQQQ